MESKFLRLHSLFGNHIERLEGSHVDQCLEMVSKFQSESFSIFLRGIPIVEDSLQRLEGTYPLKLFRMVSRQS